MSSQKTIIVDYGSGNLFSVKRALEVCDNGEVIVSDEPQDLAYADKVVLPGVGAFADCIGRLRDRGFVEPLMAHAHAGRPLLGICVGMQMLASSSEEFGHHEGLNLIPGHVRPIADKATDGAALKIPNIGWRSLQQATGDAWSNTILRDTTPNAFVYLVHSFSVEVEDKADELARCSYGGQPFTSIINRGNIYGCQFHPEKSGPEGLKILSAFLAINE